MADVNENTRLLDAFNALARVQPQLQAAANVAATADTKDAKPLFERAQTLIREGGRHVEQTLATGRLDDPQGFIKIRQDLDALKGPIMLKAVFNSSARKAATDLDVVVTQVRKELQAHEPAIDELANRARGPIVIAPPPAQKM